MPTQWLYCLCTIFHKPFPKTSEGLIGLGSKLFWAQIWAGLSLIEDTFR